MPLIVNSVGSPKRLAKDPARIIPAIVCAVVPLKGIAGGHLVAGTKIVIDLEVELFAVRKGAAADIRHRR